MNCACRRPSQNPFVQFGRLWSLLRHRWLYRYVPPLDPELPKILLRKRELEEQVGHLAPNLWK